MKFLINIIVLYLVTFQMAFGQTLINTDQVEIGKKGSTAVKQLKFRTTNQKSLSADYSTEGLSYDGNSLSVGDGTASNKTIKFNKGASSPEIRFNNATGKLEFSNDASLYKDIGSGSGGTKNYITEADGTSQGSWTTYADAAGVSPVDGTGGVPTVTYVASTDSTMRGTTNFLFTHPASNVQGNGFSYNFTIDPSDEGKVLQASLEYKVASGTFADNDLDFWIYDVTNATLIQPAPYHLKNSGIIEKFAFEFQTASNSTSYRLIGHVATATATAYTLRFTNWNVGPQAKLYGSPITDWVAYTPTITGIGTPSVNTFYYKREGDMLHVTGYFVTGTPTATTFSISLPSGMSIDSTKTINNSTYLGNFTGVGAGAVYASGGQGPWIIFPDTSTSASVVYGAVGASGIIYTKTNGNSPFAAGQGSSVSFSVPIAGWGSSQVVSSDADTRVVEASYYMSANNAPGAGAPLNFDTKISDTHGAVTTGAAWKFTAPVPGYYRISGSMDNATTATALNIFKNGVIAFNAGNIITSGSTGNLNGTIQLNAGDYIDLRPSAAATMVGGALSNTALGTTPSIIHIEKISGPSQIMASESVSASYYLSANFAASTTTPINFDTKEWDSHNSVTISPTAWKFTAPVSGTYSVKVVATPTTATSAYLILYKNGVNYKSIAYIVSGNMMNGVVELKLLAGEYIDIRPGISVTMTGTAAPSPTFLSITRLGNY